MKVLFTTALIVCLLMGLAGCRISKPYVMEKDRADQKIEGNRGYLKGAARPAPERQIQKRPFLAIDVDLPDSCETK